MKLVEVVEDRLFDLIAETDDDQKILSFLDRVSRNQKQNLRVVSSNMTLDGKGGEIVHKVCIESLHR